MGKVYVLTEFEYSTFSYNGTTERELHVHRTEEGALQHAGELGLKVVECPERDSECTIETYNLLK